MGVLNIWGLKPPNLVLVLLLSKTCFIQSNEEREKGKIKLLQKLWRLERERYIYIQKLRLN
jgi:hypothetical protein